MFESESLYNVRVVRTVFNMAISSDSPDIQRTARNALLQMLNTVVKHVTQYPLVLPSPPSVPHRLPGHHLNLIMFTSLVLHGI